jgi:RNase H-like domain found in reverse transcriptase
MLLTTKECDQEFPPWTKEHQAAFEHIKDLVLSTDCLTIINYDDKVSNIYVTTDASDCCTGAVLSFGATWETAWPVAYNSYQLNDAKKNYPVHEKELLAIVKAFKKWRSHLLGAHFEVFTDHQTLEYFQSQKEMSRQQMRWSMYMANFDYNITHICGEENTAADALSHMPDAIPDACLVEGCWVWQPTLDLRWTGETGSKYLWCTEVGTISYNKWRMINYCTFVARKWERRLGKIRCT